MILDVRLMNIKMKLLPSEMRDWYFSFDWDLERLWALDVPLETRKRRGQAYNHYNIGPSPFPPGLMAMRMM